MYSDCTVLFRKTYSVGQARTKILLLQKKGCPFYSLLLCTKSKDGTSSARIVRLCTDYRFALFVIWKLAENHISACHVADVLCDNLDIFRTEYEKGVPCSLFSRAWFS